VDAYGFKSEFTTVTILPSTTYVAIDFTLEPQTQRTETTYIEYGTDFGSFEMFVDTVWSYDDKIPGLPYNDVGSLRMQIDMFLGDADTLVDGGEAVEFESRLVDYGPEYVSSKRLLTVNDTVYSCSGNFGLFTLGSVEGNVTTVEDGVVFEYSAMYTSESAIDVGAPDYAADAYVKYDDPSVDYVYTVALPNVLPDRYELVANSTGPGTDSKVNTSGYMVFTLDPQEYVGGPEHVTMTFGKSVEPTAEAAVLTKGTDYAYEVTNETGVTMSYIVAVGHEVNFSAEASEDPNGNPLVFTWDFGDGTSLEVTYNDTIPHTYLSASANRTVNLTVTDMGGLENHTSIYVMCDALDPVPEITIKDLKVNSTSGMLEIDQGELVWFNASTSSDDAVSAGDGAGVIRFFEFEFGEGNTSGRVYTTADEQNVSYSWTDAGEYTLTLNVTDSVGHWKNTTLTVKVNDTEKPVPSFIVKNETWGTGLVEDKVLVFDANATTDNLDDREDLYFSWYFNDDNGTGSWLNGTGLWNVTHVFEKADSYAVRLNVTDTEGNWEGYTKTVTVVSGPRPSLVIDKVYFDPETFTEGETGYILVNLTNRGSAAATEIVLKFSIENADGTEEFIGEWRVVLNSTTESEVSTVAIGGKAFVKFPYKFSDPGTFTVKVNVTSADQLSVDEDVGDVTVNEAGWKKVALWGGVAAVIILVPLLMYLRGRWSKRERRGPRRERPEKAVDRKAEKAERRERERAEREKQKLEKPGKDEGL
jgi:PKD repeat protein